MFRVCGLRFVVCGLGFRAALLLCHMVFKV
jgi:hypothetical protein